MKVVSSKKAFILAAGFGTRLLPLTRVMPKPLLPLGGVPMLDRALALVRSWGVREVLVNVHHGTDAIVRHLTHRAPDELRINISFEPEILGTGGALVKASWFFSDGNPFWIINADVVADVNGSIIARAFKPGKTIASAWLMATRGPRTVECENGAITNFQSKRPGADGTFTFCGVHLVDPAILRYLPPQGFASIIEAYKRAMKDGLRVAGVPVENARWADIGSPAQYVQAESEEGSAGQVSPDQVSIMNGMIYGPGVPRKNYTGIMALRAADGLDASELALAKAWKSFKDNAVVCPLSPRGSARSFSRLYSGNRTAVLIRHQPEREENNLYVRHTEFLESLGIPVPGIIAEDKKNHIALFTDAGLVSVQDEIARRRSFNVEKLYRDVLTVMVRFHDVGGPAARIRRVPLMLPFDEKLYAWEHELFTGLFLRDRMGVDERQIAEIKKELKRVSDALVALPSVLLHRDLQSSNILLHRGKWTLIDYQGMRFGPAVYDLASLLCDPYIEIDPHMRERLLEYYAERADPASRSREMFWPAAVQRLGQALGAYARLSKIPGTAHFAGYIEPALKNLSEALARVEGLPTLAGIIHKIITPDDQGTIK